MDQVNRKPFIGTFAFHLMLRTCTILVMLVVLVYSSVQPGLLDDSPLHLEETEKLSTWEYEIVSWNPLVVNNTFWLFYDELTWGNETILKYMVYDGEWSSPETLSETGEFVATVKEGGVFTLFWNEAQRGESEITKSICSKTFDGEWSLLSCTETGQYAGREFIVTMTDETWLLWSRWGFWEYQVLLEDQWGSPQVLTTTEEYDEILDVLVVKESTWIFYKTGSSDLYYRVLQEGVLSEAYPLVTEGFPYLYDVFVYDTDILVLLEVQDAETDSKTLVYTVYNGTWSPLRAVASPEDGYLAGGSTIRMSDGRAFIFWNGTDSVEGQSADADIFYRVYDGTWSKIYALADTPDTWETSPTATEYEGNLIIIWRDKESHAVSASHVSIRDVPLEEAGELRLVTPKTEPIPPKWNPWVIKIKQYSYLVIMAVVLAGLAVLLYLKRRLSSGEKPETESAREKSKKRKESRKKK